ncbi:sigma D regulator [Halopseudomonas sp.]|uniref:sigma D regulator n=1 Tax=Halopseudomonas sp. TaxID=2901191 RepID=UPI003569C1A9
MLESCTTAQERWGGVHKLIDRWLAERKQMVQQYTQLRQTAETGEAAHPALESFCDILVDYVSAGHFEVYEQLIREAEAFQDQGGLALARQLYPRIEKITQSAVHFNDQYGRAGSDGDQDQMHKQLLQLGGLLHERFELEDCLIEVLHTAHQDMLSAS